MQYFNLDIKLLRLPEFIGETPFNRGVWISLMGYCCHLENSGRIANSRTWKSRMWEQSCGVTLAELEQESDLWQWDGDDLQVWGFPHHMQKVHESKRAAGAKGGRPRKSNDNHADNHADNRNIIQSNIKEDNTRESARERTASPVTLAEAKSHAKTWTGSSPTMVAFDAVQVELWFLDRQRKGWQASSGQIINTRALAERDLEFWLLKNKTNPSPPRREGHGNSDSGKKEKAGGGNPLAVPPCAEWKDLAAALAPHDSDLAWLQEANWTDLSSDDRQSIVNEHKDRIANAGGAA